MTGFSHLIQVWELDDGLLGKTPQASQCRQMPWELAVDHRLICLLMCDSPHGEIKGWEKNPQLPRLLI